MKTKKAKLKHPDLYRAEISAKIIKDCVKDRSTVPAGYHFDDWVLYMLASAVEDIAIGLQKMADKING